MNTGAIKSKVGRCAFFGKFSVLVLTLGLMPLQAMAATGSAQLRQYIYDVCVYMGDISTWDQAAVISMCLSAYPNISAGPGSAVNVSANLGTVNANSGVASRKFKGVHELQDEQKKRPEKGASADGGGWGFLVTPQYGNSNRTETDLENGYQSNLKGLIVGLDYRFSDSFVLGMAVGQTKDEASFFNSAGSLKISNNTATLYSTWLPTESVSIDGYLGYGKINFDGKRYVEFDAIAGTTSSSTSGRQLMGGVSASYQKDVGRFNVSPFINFDYIKTRFDGYSESGTTMLELRYGDRSTISFTNSLGVRAGTSYNYEWGTLQSLLRFSAVHEHQNNSKQIYNELVSTPGFGFSVTTDAPDRNYLNVGLGLSAALNSGTQLFIDYDKRAQDRLLSSWAISLGALMEF